LKETYNRSETIQGLLCGISAFLIWGLSPIYWKLLQMVPAFEILMHRIVWSFIFLLPFLISRQRFQEFISVIKDFRKVGMLTLSTLIVALNWFLFIWAINHDHVLQTSLGYYITPLVNVLLGTVFLNERLRLMQIIAVILAGISVGYLTLGQGIFPWIALMLAFSFGFYGLIRKTVPVTPLVGLTFETLVLSVPAVSYLIYLNNQGIGAFLSVNIRLDLILAGSALVTGLPLLLFNLGTKRLQLSTVGFLQYIAPSGTFLLAVFLFHEPVSKAQIFSFGLIWIALALYSTDSLLYYRNPS
jgi:chloramphenicol-sensitive protein RarD